MAHGATDKGTRRRPLRLLGWVLGALALVFVAAVGLVLLRPSILTEPVRARLVPKLIERTGRDVRLGALDADFFPRPQVSIRDLVIAGAQGEPDFVKAPSAIVTVRFWPLLASFGKSVEFSGVELQGSEVNLVRRSDGTWSYEEVMAQVERTRPPDDLELDFVIERAALEDAVVRLHDWSAPGAGKRPGTVGLSDLDVEALNVGIGRKLSVTAKAALQSSKQNVEAALTVDPLPQSFATLKPGEGPDVSGEFSVDGLSVESFRAFFPAKLGSLVTGGIVTLRSKLETSKDGAYAVNGRVDLSKLALRGEPAEGGFSFSATLPRENPQAVRGEIRELALKGPGIDLGGTASFRAQPMTLQFALEGSRLDTDALLAVLPADEKKDPGEAKETEPATSELMTASARKQLAETKVQGTVKLGEVVSGKLRATELDAKAVLDDGVLLLQSATGKLYEGTVSLEGTRVDLTKPQPKWDLRAAMKGVNLGAAMGEVSGFRALEGKVSSSLALSGEGNVWAKIREELTGKGQLDMADGQLTTLNLNDAVEKGLSQALRGMGRGGIAEKIESGAGTELRDVRTLFEVDDGMIQLARPVSFQSDLGKASLDGAIGLDQRLALTGTVAVSPSSVAKLTGNAFKPSGPVNVPIQIGGTLRSPQVTGVDTAGLVKSALPTEKLKSEAKERIEKETGDVEEKAKDAARRKLEGLLGK